MLAQNLRGSLGRAQLPGRRLPLCSPDSVGLGWGPGTCIPWRLWEDSEQWPGWGAGRGEGDGRLPAFTWGAAFCAVRAGGLLAVQTALVYIRWSQRLLGFFRQTETLALNGIFT